MVAGIILAGGFGERFWPMSRKNMPKQCLNLLSDKPMVEDTVERLKPLIPRKNMYISTGERIAPYIKKILPDANFAVEPMAKGTGPAIGLSALYAAEKGMDAVLFIETADHAYNDVSAYLMNVKAAIEFAEANDRIVLIGIKPTEPHTGRGYIKQGGSLKDNGIKIYNVESFREKPDYATAEEYVRSGDYLWNSGMFIAKCSVMLDAIKKHMPDLHKGLMLIKKSNFDKETIREVFDSLEPISIDYGIMEKENDLAVLRGEFHWDDIGDWAAMERIYRKDANGNVIRAEHKGTAKDCIIFGEKGRVIETDEIEGLIIADRSDCLLVCSKDAAQDVRLAADRLEETGTLRQYLEAVVAKPSPEHLNLESVDCDVKTDALVATINLNNVHIEKKNDSVFVKQKRY